MYNEQPTTCPLNAYLRAVATSSEDQAVAVLAAALNTNRQFASRVVELAGGDAVHEQHDIDVSTQIQTSTGGLDRVDLGMLVYDGILQQRVWIEAKLTAPFSGKGDRHQIAKYSAALKRLDAAGRRRKASRSRLAVLVRSRAELRTADIEAIKSAGAKVILWQEIADEAALVGSRTAGPGWEYQARQPDATLSLANLQSLVWYLKCKDFRVAIRTPVQTDAIATYEKAADAVNVVVELVRHVAQRLTDTGWKTRLDPDWDQEEFALVFGSQPIVLPSPKPWWERTGPRHGRLYFQIIPQDQRGNPTATVWVGLTFDIPTHPPDGWLEQLAAIGLEAEEESLGKGICHVGTYAPLASLIEHGETAGAQAGLIATWVQERLPDLISIDPKRRRPSVPAP